jgi:hypothetical protein
VLTPGTGETRPPAALLRERGGTLAGAPSAAVPLAEVQGEAAPLSPAPVADGAGEDTAQTQPAAEARADQPPLAPTKPAAPPAIAAQPAPPTADPLSDETLASRDDPAPGAAALVVASAPPPALTPPALTPPVLTPPALSPPPRAEALPLVRGGTAPLTAKAALPAASPSASPAPAPASLLTGEDSAAPAPKASPAESLPEAAAQPAQPSPPQPAAPQLAAASAPVPQPAPTATPSDTPPLAATLEDTIAQADTLREALRAQRPELTLRHAEFGAVSLRLEATGSESWRAVLSARDPGFVPAVQAALTERAVSAPTDTTGSFLSQNGTSDQRYGASPNGGQGGHSPHLSQSGARDGEAAPDHRRPSTAATLAGRDQQEGEGSGSSPARQSRGLFA